MTEPVKPPEPRYSGPNRSGMCVCGCRWSEHHLGIVMNEEYRKQTGESYIPQECETFRFNEVGGRKWDGTSWQDHCQQYRDTMLAGQTDLVANAAYIAKRLRDLLYRDRMAMAAKARALADEDKPTDRQIGNDEIARLLEPAASEVKVGK